MVSRLRDDLMGPLKPDEVLASRPSDVYLTGILWPPQTQLGQEDNDTLAIGSSDGSSGSEGDVESAIAGSSIQKPSVAGLSFCVQASSEPCIDLSIRFARYLAEEDEESGETVWRRAELSVEIPGWRPCSQPPSVRLADYDENAEGVEVAFRVVKSDDTHLITVSVINYMRLEEDASRTEREQANLYQLGVRVSGSNGSCLVPKPDRSLSDTLGGAGRSEEASNALLFRNARQFAVGHVCSAEWPEPRSTESGRQQVEYVQTSWMPSSVVPGVSAGGHALFAEFLEAGGGASCLSAKHLAMASDVELKVALEAICNAYAAWLDHQKKTVKTLTEQQQLVAAENLKTCEHVLNRIRNSVDLICQDEQMKQAFQLANLAMDTQYRWNSKDREVGLTW